MQDEIPAGFEALQMVVARGKVTEPIGLERGRMTAEYGDREEQRPYEQCRPGEWGKGWSINTLGCVQ